MVSVTVQPLPPQLVTANVYEPPNPSFGLDTDASAFAGFPPIRRMTVTKIKLPNRTFFSIQCSLRTINLSSLRATRVYRWQVDGQTYRNSSAPETGIRHLFTMCCIESLTDQSDPSPLSGQLMEIFCIMLPICSLALTIRSSWYHANNRRRRQVATCPS